MGWRCRTATARKLGGEPVDSKRAVTTNQKAQSLATTGLFWFLSARKAELARRVSALLLDPIIYDNVLPTVRSRLWVRKQTHVERRRGQTGSARRRCLAQSQTSCGELPREKCQPPERSPTRDPYCRGIRRCGSASPGRHVAIVMEHKLLL
jgi:hypothetical protein